MSRSAQSIRCALSATRKPVACARRNTRPSMVGQSCPCVVMASERSSLTRVRVNEDLGEGGGRMSKADSDVRKGAQREDADAGRRNLALGLLGAIGGVGLLDACVAGSDGATPDQIERLSSALSGGNVIQFDTLSNLRATSGT